MKKLNSRRGESIAETLVALLLSALALVMLAAAITSSTRVITASREKLKAYYDDNEQSNGVVKMLSAEGSTTISITSSDDLPTQSYTVACFVNDEFSQTPVISYKK